MTFGFSIAFISHGGTYLRPGTPRRNRFPSCREIRVEKNPTESPAWRTNVKLNKYTA